jgi:hypothetical protein
MAEISWFGIGEIGSGGSSSEGVSERSPDVFLTEEASVGASERVWEDLSGGVSRAPLNTLVYDNIGGFSLSGNIITCPPGVYKVKIVVQIYHVQAPASNSTLQIGLYNDTDSSYFEGSRNVHWLNEDSLDSTGFSNTLYQEIYITLESETDIYVRGYANGLVAYSSNSGMENSSIRGWVGIWSSTDSSGNASVISWNAHTGTVVVDADDLPPSSTRGYIPDGGGTGQVLTKQSSSDFDVDWENVSGTSVTAVNGQTGVVQLNLNDIPIDWTDLAPATYGDLDVADYVALTSGLYRMTALGSELSNYPASLSLTSGTTYILYMKIINDLTNNFSYQEFIILQDGSSAIIGDISLRYGFSLTDFSGLDWFKQVIINDEVIIGTNSSGLYSISSLSNLFITQNETSLATASSSTPPLYLIGNSLPETAPHLKMIRGAATCNIYFGSGNPQGAVTPISMGDVYIRTSGGPGIWFNLSGTSTGWRKGASLHNTTSISSDGTNPMAFSDSAGFDFNEKMSVTSSGTDPVVILEDSGSSTSREIIRMVRGSTTSSIYFGNASPVGSVTPNSIGDIFVNQASGAQIWIAVTADSGGWRKTAALHTSTSIIGSPAGLITYSGAGGHTFSGGGAETHTCSTCTVNATGLVTIASNVSLLATCPTVIETLASQGPNCLILTTDAVGYDYQYILFSRDSAEDACIGFGETSPVGVFTPAFPGHIFIDSSTPAIWIGISGADDQAWERCITASDTASKSPTTHYFSSSGSITVNSLTPGATKYVGRIVGGGGGASGSGLVGAGSGADGGDSIWDTAGTPITVVGGGGATPLLPGAGGIPSASDTSTVIRYQGESGAPLGANGGRGGSSIFSAGANPTDSSSDADGSDGIKGAGGSGATYAGAGMPGGGGGESADIIIIDPTGSYSFTLGSGGAGGDAGASGFTGGDGGDAYFVLTAYYGTNP